MAGPGACGKMPSEDLMHIPIDEIIVFAPITIAIVYYASRQAFLAVKYRNVP